MKKFRNATSTAVLRLMADGKPRTAREVAEALGVTIEQARSAFKVWRDMFELPPPTYTITSAGVQMLAEIDAPKPKRVKKYTPTGRPRGRPRKAPVVVVHRSDEDEPLHPYDHKTIVRMGMQSRTPLDLAWGAVA